MEIIQELKESKSKTNSSFVTLLIPFESKLSI